MENLPEMELLQYIYKTADMGCEGIDAVEKHAEQKLLAELRRERNEYESVRSDADQMIRKAGDEPSGTGVMAKMSTDMMTAAEMMMDEDEEAFDLWLQQALASGLFCETSKRRKSWSPFKLNQKKGKKQWRRTSC